MRAVRSVVSGRVHGVGFRYSTQQEATRLGVTGWVRNRPDGTVEVWAQGDEEAMQAFVDFLHRGPRAARVRAVEVDAAQPDAGCRSFDVTF